jgi:hypothetical protein
MPGSGGPEEPGTTTEESCSAPVRGLRWRRVFPGEDRQLGVLRSWLAALLPDGPLRDDVTAIASELAGNAIVHTASGRGGWFAVEIAWHHHLVRVAVADCGATGAPRLMEDPDGEHGRGLLVVRGLSVRSGVCGDQRGRLVWADVLWEEPETAPEEPARDPYQSAIRDGQAELARRFHGVPAWFGRSTLQWWAVADPVGLITAPTASDLANLLGNLLSTRYPALVPRRHSAASGLPGQRRPTQFRL